MSHHPTDRPTGGRARNVHSCGEKTPVATPTPAPARTPCPQGCGKTTFCTHARTHARGFRADEASASRGGGFTAIHSSLNSTHGVRRFTTPLAREKKSSCSCSSAARTFSADCKQQTRFLSSTALARRACSGARARASAVGDFATPRVRPRRQKTPTAPTVYGTNPTFYSSIFD